MLERLHLYFAVDMKVSTHSFPWKISGQILILLSLELTLSQQGVLMVLQNGEIIITSSFS